VTTPDPIPFDSEQEKPKPIPFSAEPAAVATAPKPIPFAVKAPAPTPAPVAPKPAQAPSPSTRPAIDPETYRQLGESFKDQRDQAGAAPDVYPQFERAYKSVHDEKHANVYQNMAGAEKTRLGRDLTPVEQNRLHQRISLTAGTPTPREHAESQAVAANPGDQPIRAAIEGAKQIAPAMIEPFSPETAGLIRHEQFVAHPVAPTPVNQVAGMLGNAARDVAVIAGTGGAGLPIITAQGALEGVGQGRREAMQAREQGQQVSGGQEAAAAAGYGAIRGAGNLIGADVMIHPTGGIAQRIGTNIGTNAAIGGLSQAGENVVARESGVDAKREPMSNVPHATAAGGSASTGTRDPSAS
jgi:hypothetical protein